MKVLFIGGTGNISTPVSKLSISKGIDLYLLTRGTVPVTIEGAKVIKTDINNPQQVQDGLKGHEWDVVVNWIAFTPEEIQRDIDLFKGKTKQYIFISSASVYQKPPLHPVITESTPLYNPFWQYSRDKIACEELLNSAYQTEDFPITIIRPSLTYDTVIPVTLGGWKNYNIVDRIRKGKEIIIQGDGSSLWTITHADDFAIGVVGLFGHQQATGHAFHITSDEILTWNQIYEAVGDAVGCKLNVVHIASDFICKIDPEKTGSLLGDKALSVIFDNTKIKTFVPEFNATITFKKGIKRTIDWFEADPTRMVINPEAEAQIEMILAAYRK
ncbi:MAG: SDR family oxidoreductase [Bacteroidetes bacterium]|nr:SDR family oxidoreductase [Bacteroidota bacterium]MDA1122335.1 SDR family oxidoreductase [Bacteroidota bacterium]